MQTNTLHFCIHQILLRKHERHVAMCTQVRCTQQNHGEHIFMEHAHGSMVGVVFGISHSHTIICQSQLQIGLVVVLVLDFFFLLPKIWCFSYQRKAMYECFPLTVHLPMLLLQLQSIHVQQHHGFYLPASICEEFIAMGICCY